MKIILLICIIIILIVLFLTLITIRKGYSFKHKIDSKEQNPYKNKKV